MNFDAQLAYSRQRLGVSGILTRKVGQTVLACDQGSLIGPCIQDYKSLYAAVTICSTLVDIQTHIHKR